MANETIPLFRPGNDLTAVTTTAVTGGRMVELTATRSTVDGLMRVGTATAAGRALGVAVTDAASGARVAVIAAAGVIVPVQAGGTIAFGAQVEVGTLGQVVTIASGVAVGRAVEAGTNGNPVMIRLYVN
jgi:predicted transcriptional regulator